MRFGAENFRDANSAIAGGIAGCRYDASDDKFASWFSMPGLDKSRNFMLSLYK